MPRRSPSRYFSSSSARSRAADSKRLVSVRLPDELLKRLAAVGNEEELAMSDTIRLVLERGLSAPKKGVKK